MVKVLPMWVIISCESNKEKFYMGNPCDITVTITWIDIMDYTKALTKFCVKYGILFHQII